MLFKVIPNEYNEKKHDLFIGEAVAAWLIPASSEGHRHFPEGDDSCRTLHYVAGGHFLTIGNAHDIKL